jgi:ribosome-binding factor A
MSSISSIKKSQKETQLYRAISELFTQTALDDPRLQGIAVNRVKLSDDKSVCNIFFYCANGLAEFKEKLPFILLYKSSLRRALAKTIAARYTPELIFKFDDQFEKQQRIENLLEKIKGDDSSTS